MGNKEFNYISISAICKTLEHGQKISPYKLYKELKIATEYGLKYIYIKNAKETVKFEVSRMIQLLEDWRTTKQKYLLIDFPAESKGMNFARIKK